jgi:hypothetical protein
MSVFLVALLIQSAAVFRILGTTGSAEGGVVVHAGGSDGRNMPAFFKDIDFLCSILGGADLNTYLPSSFIRVGGYFVHGLRKSIYKRVG